MDAAYVAGGPGEGVVGTVSKSGAGGLFSWLWSWMPLVKLSWWTVLLGTPVLFYAAKLSLLWIFQEKFIYPSYFPPGSRSRHDMTPQVYGLSHEDVTLRTEDGVALHSWLVWRGPHPSESDATRPVILMLHGNAGNVSHRCEQMRTLLEATSDAVILALEYRGYGLSEGTASERGLKLDAQAGLEYLRNHPARAVREGPLFVYGQSLGGAVSIALAAAHGNKITGGLIVENTFTTVREVIDHFYPKWTLIPIAAPLILRSQWNSLGAVKTFQGLRVLFVSGDKDEMLDPAWMRKLADAVPPHRNNVTFASIPGGMHNTTWMSSQFVRVFEQFVAQARL